MGRYIEYSCIKQLALLIDRFYQRAKQSKSKLTATKKIVLLTCLAVIYLNLNNTCPVFDTSIKA